MKSRVLLATAVGLLSLFTKAHAQEIIPLYKDSIPGAQDSINLKIKKKIKLDELMPDIRVYRPAVQNACQSAVLIIPGGAYGMVSLTNEGSAIAQQFIAHGVTAFVLNYRLPNDAIMKDKRSGPLQDAQKALQMIRENAKKWDIDSSKVGTIGFSAGGHLASTLGTHFNKAFVSNPANISLRPDFMILVYPVISMKTPIAHEGSKENLIGKKPTAQDIEYYSNEDQVTANTPPTYLTHTTDDGLVPVENSIVFYEACVKNKVPVAMNLPAKGNHGFIMGIQPDEYLGPIYHWMKDGGFLK